MVLQEPARPAEAQLMCAPGIGTANADEAEEQLVDVDESDAGPSSSFFLVGLEEMRADLGLAAFG